MPHRTHDGQEQVREAKRYPIEECDGLDDRLWDWAVVNMTPCPHCRAMFLGAVCPICKKERS